MISHAAGGGAYYFAKRTINADRAARHEASQNRKEEAARMEARYGAPKSPIPVPPTPRPSYPSAPLSSLPALGASAGNGSSVHRAEMNEGSGGDDIGSPSEETGHDPAPTRDEPHMEAQRITEKGKYEAAETFRSKKGNRFS